SYDEYYNFLVRRDEEDAEFNELLNLITINETYFFRFREQFEALERDILPELIKTRKNSTKGLRIWSAACSTGAEPYTIAMILKNLKENHVRPYVDIVATDVSHKALAEAREGVYSTRVVEQKTPENYIERYFERSQNKYILSEEIKNMVNLEYFNLIRTPFPAETKRNFDIIFCRNVTIYFRPESIQRVIDQFYESLNEGGYLFLGHSETLDDFETDFKLVMLNDVFLYKKDSKRIKKKETALKPHKKKPVLDNLFDSLARISPLPPPVQLSDKNKSGREKIDEARKLLESGKDDADLKHKALLLLKQALEDDSPSVEIYLLVAQIQSDMNYYDEALENCRRALELDSCCLEAHLVVGLIYMTQGKTSLAVDELGKVIYLDPQHTLAYFYLGNLYQDNDKPREAKKVYQQVVRTLENKTEPVRLGDIVFTVEEFRNICSQQINRIQQETE
ncbi:MAG: CheR family methyltransferase, partial [bacterium]